MPLSAVKLLEYLVKRGQKRVTKDTTECFLPLT